MNVPRASGPARPHPTTIRLLTRSRALHVDYDDGQGFDLPFEYLRVYSPSAEVKGHGPGQSVLQTGKEDVNIVEVTPVGNYAVKLHFDDGHDTGIYSWDYLYDLGRHRQRYWQDYLDRLTQAGYQRDSQG